jgi:hypothetical protein
MAPNGRKPRKTTPLADSSVATSGAPLLVRLPSTLGSIPLSAIPISDKLSELLFVWWCHVGVVVAVLLVFMCVQQCASITSYDKYQLVQCVHATYRANITSVVQC